MSETKHTPTPWIRDGLSIYALDELPGVYIKGKPVQANRMYIRIEDHPNGLASKEETEANAALVFAAPDLLKFAQQITGLLAHRPHGEEDREKREAAIQLAWEFGIDAIGRAEGRSE